MLFYKWKVKKVDESLIVFSLMFLTFGIIFAVKGLAEVNALNPALAFFFSGQHAAILAGVLEDPISPKFCGTFRLFSIWQGLC